MKKNKKYHKPSGTIGTMKISGRNGNINVGFEKYSLSKSKIEIEYQIAHDFINSAKNHKTLLVDIYKILRNGLDDLDFTITTEEGNKYLELMEIAPLDFYGKKYDNISESYRPYDLAQYIFNKIKGKSEKYKSILNQSIILLVYITDWRFTLSTTVICLLQYWTLNKDHCFESIYYFMPFLKEDGISELIFPTPKSHWKYFNPDIYKNNIVHNINPMNWHVEKSNRSN